MSESSYKIVNRNLSKIAFCNDELQNANKHFLRYDKRKGLSYNSTEKNKGFRWFFKRDHLNSDF